MMLREAVWGSNNVGWRFAEAGAGFGAGALFGILVLAALVWTLYWKYRAIWHAVKHDQKIWTVVFLVVNTLGILEILYLYWLSKYHKS